METKQVKPCEIYYATGRFSFHMAATFVEDYCNYSEYMHRYDGKKNHHYFNGCLQTKIPLLYTSINRLDWNTLVNSYAMGRANERRWKKFAGTKKRKTTRINTKRLKLIYKS